MRKNLEQFEQEYIQEISELQGLRFKHEPVPEFKIPGYSFVLSRAMQIAFAVPAFVAAFGFFFYLQGGDPNGKDLSLLEESNNRILNQIDTLDHESNI